MKKSGLIALLLPVMLFFFASCGGGDVYKQYKEMPSCKWARIEEGKSVKFENIDISKENESYDISVMIRHTPQVNENKIKFKMLITSPSGSTRESVHEINLRDRSGNGWAGDALGDLIDVEEVCKKYITLAEKGLYTVELVNMGTKYETTGIKELGLRIVKSDLEIKSKK